MNRIGDVRDSGIPLLHPPKVRREPLRKHPQGDLIEFVQQHGCQR
jgi:hypothetical protein